jgi:endonuclease/exonuclease/phosphatase family metal-dependent hydrolase
VLAVIEKLDVDILVLPETWVPHDGVGVVDELRAHGYEVAVDRWVTLKHGVRNTRLSSPGDAWWSLAVASRLPVVARHDLPLPRTISDPAAPRVAIQLSVDVGGVVVDAVGLHTSSRLWWGAPIVHLHGLRKQLPPPGRPAFIAGDFNLWGPGVELLLPGFHRTVLGRTYPSHRPHSQIDHVLVNDRLTCVSAEVIDDRRSDHRPVRATLRA